MSFESGRPSAHVRSDAAVLRGGAAGLVSGALAVAAHGWISGAAPPESGPLTLLIAVSAAVGALVSGVNALRTTWLGLVAALVGGQLLGHVSMMWGSPGQSHHHHHSAGMWSPAMLAAHTVAAVFAAVVIVGAEAAYRIVTTVLSWVLPIPLALPVPAGPAALPIGHRDRVVLRVLAADAFRTRGPPALVRV
ncbi:hypothetical protein [Nocardia huaxiensis]|uniref:Uncharacterized protein n=1 Tax=Nocardia huaxiensis TaxID=2755382 RepID=A0A7D6ZDM5_9NOCA|nr:hypothetical protein [Nocardia huaxiensis]QLY33028.1 hypothetical protein H0264_13025 [Nocardia huaxiensis]UFS93209.1 hypothetical protein LPY97_20335 [Nocardia huaxiensis]